MAESDGAVPHKAPLERVPAEFLEMPDLRLTVEQVERLCGVEPTLCKAILDALADAKFLYWKSNGVYARLTDISEPWGHS